MKPYTSTHYFFHFVMIQPNFQKLVNQFIIVADIQKMVTKANTLTSPFVHLPCKKNLHSCVEGFGVPHLLSEPSIKGVISTSKSANTTKFQSTGDFYRELKEMEPLS